MAPAWHLRFHTTWTLSHHSPTVPEARLRHQKQIRCPDPPVSMPTVERPKPMHVRRTILCLAATFLWATHDPNVASGQSSELMIRQWPPECFYGHLCPRAILAVPRQFKSDHPTITEWDIIRKCR